MKAYGLNKNNSSNFHPHNKCGICNSHPPEKGQARLREKQITNEEYNLYVNFIEEDYQSMLDQGILNDPLNVDDYLNRKVSFYKL